MSRKPHIAVIVGSLRQESINRKLANALELLAGDAASFQYLRIDDLALYNQDLDADFPAPWTRFKEAVKAADGVLFVTPEYNRSVPGVLKNAIDIASRPYGTNAFAGKPAAAVGASPGAPGTSMAQQHLRNIMLYLDMQVLGQPEVYLQFKDGTLAADGSIADAGTRKFLQGFLDRFLGSVPTG